MINQMFIAFGLYFGLLISAGIFFYRRSKTSQSFLSGNHSLNFWVTAIAAQCSDMSAWLFLAYPGVVYAKGAFEVWTAVGLVLFMYLNWKLIATRLRTQTAVYNCFTLPSFLEKRFDDQSGAIRITGAIFAILFFILYASSGIVGLGRLFESSLDIPYQIGIIAGVSIAVTYAAIGGFLAVSWLNLFKGLFLLLVIVTVPIIGFFKIGGLAAIKSAALIKHVSLNIFPSFSSILAVMGSMAAFGLGYFGQPHILASFIGIDDPKNLQKSTYVGLTWQVIVLTAALAVGLVGIGFYPNGIDQNEHLFVYLAKQLLSPLLYGFALCGILAATISTINTQVLVAACNLSEDLYRRTFKQHTAAQALLISRLSTIAIAIAALIIASFKPTTIYNLVLYAWSGLGSTFGPAVIMALYGHKSANRYGIFTGLLAGALTAIFWPLLHTNIPTLVMGFGINFALILLISYLTRHIK